MSVKVGQKWTKSFLECVAKAARFGLDELDRLQIAERKAHEIGGTARSALPAAIRFAIRSPVFTANSLSAGIVVTPQAASVLIRQMLKMEMIREVTKRAAWRALSIK